MKKKPKTTKRNEFRKLNTKEGKGHPHYIYGQTGNKYQSIGITHAKKTKGTLNIPLKQNPDRSDQRPAYVRPMLTNEKKENYGKRLDGLGLGDEDKKKVWALIEKLRTKK